MSSILYVPTLTGRPRGHNKAPVALCSPSEVNPILVRGSELTIVDCHTFYLRKRPRLATQHYTWYVQFVKDNMGDPSLVFVAPDWDWVGQFPELLKSWPRDARCLVVPGTQVHRIHENVAGNAMTKCSPRIPHPEWVHHFGKNYSEFPPGVSRIQTYDSMEHPGDNGIL